jgi:hypothetical protein
VYCVVRHVVLERHLPQEPVPGPLYLRKHRPPLGLELEPPATRTGSCLSLPEKAAYPGSRRRKVHYSVLDLNHLLQEPVPGTLYLRKRRILEAGGVESTT